MMKEFLLLVLWLGLLHPSSLFAQESKPYPPLPPEFESRFMKAVKESSASFSLPPAAMREEGDFSQKNIWTSSLDNSFSVLTGINLFFSRLAELPPPVASAPGSPEFEVKLLVDRAHQLLRIQNLRSMEAVIRLDPKSLNGRQMYWLHGTWGTGLFVLVPRHDANETARALLLCPRDLSERGIRPDNYLLDTAFRVSRAQFAYDARNKTHLITGRKTGVAKVGIHTSSFVPASVPAEDESRSSNPGAEIVYHPDASGQEKQVVQPADVTGALELVQELRSPAGHRRVIEITDYAWVKQIGVDTSFAIAIREGPNNYRINTGSGACFIVMFDRKEQVRWYSKVAEAEKGE